MKKKIGFAILAIVVVALLIVGISRLIHSTADPDFTITEEGVTLQGLNMDATVTNNNSFVVTVQRVRDSWLNDDILNAVQLKPGESKNIGYVCEGKVKIHIQNQHGLLAVIKP